MKLTDEQRKELAELGIEENKDYIVYLTGNFEMEEEDVHPDKYYGITIGDPSLLDMDRILHYILSGQYGDDVFVYDLDEFLYEFNGGYIDPDGTLVKFSY